MCKRLKVVTYKGEDEPDEEEETDGIVDLVFNVCVTLKNTKVIKKKISNTRIHIGFQTPQIKRRDGRHTQCQESGSRHSCTENGGAHKVS